MKIFRLIAFLFWFMAVLPISSCQIVVAAPDDNLLDTALFIVDFIDDTDGRLRYLEHLAATLAQVGALEQAIEIIRLSENQVPTYCPLLRVITQLAETGHLTEAGNLLERDMSVVQTPSCPAWREGERGRALATVFAHINELEQSLNILHNLGDPIEQAIGYAQVASILTQKGRTSQAEESFTLALNHLPSSRTYIYEEKLSLIVSAFAQAGKIDTALEIVDSQAFHEEDKPPYIASIVAISSNNGDIVRTKQLFERMMNDIESMMDDTFTDRETGLTTLQPEAKLLKLSEVVVKLAHADDTKWADKVVRQIVKNALSLQRPSFLRRIVGKFFKRASPPQQSFFPLIIMRNLAEAGYGDEARTLFESLQETLDRPAKIRLTESIIEGLFIGDDPENAFRIAKSESLRDEHLWGMIAARLTGKHDFEKALDIVRTMENWKDKTRTCAYMAIQALLLDLDEQQQQQFAQQLFEAYADKTLIRSPGKNLYEVACSLAHISESDYLFDEAQVLGKIASVLIDINQTTLAENALERAMNSVDNWALARTGIVEALLKMGNYKRILWEVQRIKTEQNQLHKLYSVASTAIMIENPTGAYEALNAAIEIASSLEDGQKKVLALAYVADLFSQSGHLSEAKTVTLTMLQNLSVVESASHKSRILGNLAEILAKTSESSRADNLFTQAIETTQFIEESGERANVLRHIAVNLTEAKRFEQAAELFTQAIETAQFIERSDDQANILWNIVENLAEAERFDQALDVAYSITETEVDAKSLALMLIAIKLARTGDMTRALTITDSIENTTSKGNTLEVISEEFAKTNAIERALEIVSLNTETRHMVSAYCRIADVLSEQEDFEQAGALCEQALQAIGDIDGFTHQRELQTIALSLAKARNFEKALEIAQTQKHHSGYRREMFLPLALYALSLDLAEEEQTALTEKIIAAYNQPTKD